MLETHKSKKSSNYRSLKKINRFISVINKKEGASCITTHLLSCFWAIIPNREVKFICLPCLVLLAFLFFSLFCLLSWGQQIFSGDYLYTCEVFFLSLLLALLLGYYIISYPYHIIYLASISSYAFLFLCLKECYASVYLPLSSLFMVTFDYEIR